MVEDSLYLSPQVTMSTTQHFDSAGTDIAYLDTGEHGESGQLPVLLIHGFASNIATNWIAPKWVETLQAAGHRVVALDNRGHGESEKPHDLARYSSPIMAEDAYRLLVHRSINRCHVMGYSMGARISAFLAIAHPERVAKVVFGGMGANMVRGMAGTGPVAAALEAPSLDDVTNPTARTFRIFAEQTKSDLKALAACIRSSRAPITAEMVARISNEVLVAVGESDVIAGPAEDLAKLMPHARAFTIPKRDHMKAVGDKTFKSEVVAFFGSRGN